MEAEKDLPPDDGSDDDNKKMPAKKDGDADESSSPSPSSKRKRQSRSGKSNHQKRWEEMYNRLADFYRIHGHSNVPNRYPEDPQLGSWVSAQRRGYKTITSGSTGSTAMTLERATKLKKLRFEWEAMNPNNVSWETRYNELLSFVKKYGHANVPMRWKENIQLSNWVSKQRHDYKLLQRGTSSRLTEKRKKLLNDVGFVWGVERGSSIAQLQRLSVVGLPTRKSRKSKGSDSDNDEDGDDGTGGAYESNAQALSSQSRDPPGSSSAGDHNQPPSPRQQQQRENPFAAMATHPTATGGAGATTPNTWHLGGRDGQTFRPAATNAGGVAAPSALQMLVVGQPPGGNNSSTINNMIGAMMNPMQTFPFAQGAAVGMGRGTGTDVQQQQMRLMPYQQPQEQGAVMLSLPWMQQGGAAALPQHLLSQPGAPQQLVLLALPPNFQGFPGLTGAGAAPFVANPSQNTGFADSSSANNTAANPMPAAGAGPAGAGINSGANVSNSNALNNSSVQQINAASALIYSALAAASGASTTNMAGTAVNGPSMNNIASFLASALGSGGAQQLQQMQAANIQGFQSPPTGGTSAFAASAPTGGSAGPVPAHATTAVDGSNNTNTTANMGNSSSGNQMQQQFDPTATLAAILGGVGGIGTMNPTATLLGNQQQIPQQSQFTAQSLAAAFGGGSLGIPSNPSYPSSTSAHNPTSETTPNMTTTTTRNTTATTSASAPSVPPTGVDPPAQSAGPAGTGSGDPMGVLAAALSQYFQTSSAPAPPAQTIPGTITVNTAQRQQQGGTAMAEPQQGGDGTGERETGEGKAQKRPRYDR